MLGNYLSAALRNLARNRLHSVITTVSLAVGFAAMIVTILTWRYDHGYDRFWPNANRLYGAVVQVTDDRGVDLTDGIASRLARTLALEVPGIEAIARLDMESLDVTVGPTTFEEPLTFWADPNVFDVLQPKVISGNPRTALADPSSAVIAKSLATRFFGDTDPVGQVLRIQTPHRKTPQDFSVRIAAVIEDWPEQSHLITPALYLSTASSLAKIEQPDEEALTYFRARPGLDREALERSFAAVSKRHVQPKATEQRALIPRPIGDLYLSPAGFFSGGYSDSGAVRHADSGNVNVFLALGGLILGVAAINFITLMTARGSSRAVEVGIRKAAGGRRRDLVLQFVGEAVLYALLAFIASVAIAEMFLPLVRTLTTVNLRLSYPADLPMLGTLALAAMGVGLVAGFYPALALSSFRPARVLKGGLVKSPGSAALRQILLTVQFVPLVLLALGALTLGAQFAKSARNAATMSPPDIMVIFETCTEGLRSRIEGVPGVRSASCVDLDGRNFGIRTGSWFIGDEQAGEVFKPGSANTEAGIERLNTFLTDAQGLAFHDIEILAGRFWTSEADANGVVINESSMRALGYQSPAGAVGQPVSWKLGDTPKQSTILGVTRDRGGFADYERPLYYTDPAAKRQLYVGVKFTGQDEAAALASMDKAWEETGARRPMQRQFYRDWISEQRTQGARISSIMGGIVGTGLVIAVMGLFGLAAFLAQQRTKEVGVRKALGAGRGQMVRLLMFQFVKPVIFANLIAIPLVIFGIEVLMARLPPDGRFTPGPEVYGSVLLGSLALAVAATFLHAWRTASARPVTALRYE